MDPSYKHRTVVILEDALVNEFRIFQSLVELSKKELEALTKRDTTMLSSLVEQKEILLDDLNELEETRRTITEDFAYLAGIDIDPPTLQDIYPYLDKATYERMHRIQDGIIALAREIRNLNRNNLALAKTALEWADATQAYLLSLHQPEFETYQAPGKNPKRQGAVRSFDQWV